MSLTTNSRYGDIGQCIDTTFIASVPIKCLGLLAILFSVQNFGLHSQLSFPIFQCSFYDLIWQELVGLQWEANFLFTSIELCNGKLVIRIFSCYSPQFSRPVADYKFKFRSW